MADSSYAALSNIRTKVRRLTRNPSTNQISDTDIDSYINTFMLYDMPNEIKPDILNSTLTFYTEPNIDTYETNAADVNHPLYNFKNKYVKILKPILVSGTQISLFQSEQEFYSYYPQDAVKINIDTGDGVTTNFTGTLSNIPILQNFVTANSIDTGGDPLIAYDDGAGSWDGDVSVPGTITYLTGAYDITFDVAPANGEEIYIQAKSYNAAKPSSVLFTKEKFIFRPVPDMVYRVDVNVYQRPTELALATDMPELAELSQYIAYGAAIKILQDRLDMDTVQLLAPEFDRQEALVMRRTYQQLSEQRTPTIFTSARKVWDYYEGDQ
jgi:hypothetical protein